MEQTSYLALPALNRQTPVECSVCGGSDLLYLGNKDFSYSCNDHFQGQNQFVDSKTPVHYYRCEACFFVFTAAFDTWGADEFKAHVYNANYHLADPLFLSERPFRNAQMVAALWNRALAITTTLDYGGGDGAFAMYMGKKGFKCQSYDAFHGGQAPEPGETFDIVTCFEVIEHVPHLDLNDWFCRLASFVSPVGTLLLSTELIDNNPNIGNWYIAPRNGHISLHSAASLQHLAEVHGMTVYSINHEMHLLRPIRERCFGFFAPPC